MMTETWRGFNGSLLDEPEDERSDELTMAIVGMLIFVASLVVAGVCFWLLRDFSSWFGIGI